MSAIKKACNTTTSVRNTGKECDTAMGPTAMLIALDPNVKFTDTDLLDPVGWLSTLIHQRKAFPIFGQNAPIRTITNAAENDITITMDDGTIIFVRYGIYNRTFATTSGGLCYAQALQSFNRSGFKILEIDKTGQGLIRKNTDGTYSGLNMEFMYSPSPGMADLKSTVYTNRFQVSLNPEELVNNGVITTDWSQVLSMQGLIDVLYTKPTASSTTKLRIGVQTECASTDLLALFGSALAVTTNFAVYDKATPGTPVSITAAAIVGGVLELTGTFVTGHTYVVTGTAPTVWKTALVEGYDGTVAKVEISIP